MIKKIILTIALLMVTGLPVGRQVLPTLAQEATDSANQSLTDKIKERLQDTAEQGLDTIKEALTEQASAPRPKAYVGAITAMTQNTITLQFKNETLVVGFDEDTEIVQARGRVALDPEDLEGEEFFFVFCFFTAGNLPLKTK